MAAVLSRSLPLDMQGRVLPDDFNVLTGGVIDSFGFVEMLVALEERLQIVADLSDLDPEALGAVGPMAAHLAKGSGG
jgi:acyl carrier protein